jgi:hypothetical protein
MTTDERAELAVLRRENRRLREERDILKIRGLVCSGDELDAAEAFRFMMANQAMHSVRAMCRALDVSPSGFYAARNRPPSPRAVVEAELSSRIRVIHDESRGTYGVPRVHAELAASGARIARKSARPSTGISPISDGIVIRLRQATAKLTPEMPVNTSNERRRHRLDV